MKFLIVLALTLTVGSAAFVGSRATRESVVIPPHVLAFLQAFLAKPEVQAAIGSSSFYQCLDKGVGGLNYEFLKALHAAGNFNPEYIRNHPVVQGCVAEEGGIVGLVSSPLFGRLVAFIKSQGLEEKVAQAIVVVLGEETGGKLLALIGSIHGKAAFLADNRESVVIPPHVLAFLQAFLAKPEVRAAIASSSFYQCLDAGVGGLNYEFLKALHAAGNFNPEYIRNHPVVQGCVAAEGGIIGLVNSPLFGRLVAFIKSQGLEEKVAQAIVVVLGEETGGRLLALIKSIHGKANFAASNSGSIDIPPHVLAFLQAFLAKPEVRAAIASSSFYQCLDAGVGGLNYEFLKALHAAGNFNPEYIRNHPVVQGCVAAEGGIVGLVSSPLFGRLVAFIKSQGLEDKVAQAIVVVLGEETGGRLLALIAQIHGKALFLAETRESVVIPPHVLAFLQAFLAKPEVRAAIASSSFYQCLDAGVGGLNYEFLKALHAAGNFNPEYIRNHPVVQGCVAEEGGIVGLVSSPLFGRLVAFIKSQGLEEKVAQAIVVVLGEETGGKLLALIKSVHGKATVFTNNRASIEIPPHVLAFLQAFLEKPEVRAAIASSSFYQCLDKGVGGLNYEFLKALHAAGNFNPEYIRNHPVVQSCVAQEGGIVELVKSPLFKRLVAYIKAEGLQEKVHQAVIVVLGEELGGKLLALIAAHSTY